MRDRALSLASHYLYDQALRSNKGEIDMAPFAEREITKEL